MRVSSVRVPSVVTTSITNDDAPFIGGANASFRFLVFQPTELGY